MAFQYSHHRPLTPITPVHSPHPSFGSIRTRTPGQLSLHDYRKQQVTPSPPAIRGQKTVKRKLAASSLKNLERIPPDSPNAPLLAPDYFESTPPLTPSLENSPPDFQLSLPQVFQTGTFSHFFPELEYLASTDLDLSPPHSPSFFNGPASKSFLPALLPSPTSVQPQHTSSYFAQREPPDSSRAHSRPRSEHRDKSEQLERLVEVTHNYLDRLDSREVEKRESDREYDKELAIPLLPGPGLQPGSYGGAARQVSQAASAVAGFGWRGVGGSERKQGGFQDVLSEAQHL
jgi:hypothetical protein